MSGLELGTSKRIDDLCRARILKAYGTGENDNDYQSALARYESTKKQVGITPDHAANFERYGVILQPKQLEFAVWARRCDDDNGPTELGFGGARGPGKSFAMMAQAALDDCQRKPGLKVLYLRKTGKAAQEQLEDLVTGVLGNFPHKDASTYRIKFHNGSRIVIGGFKDDTEALKYQGLEYDIVIIEETTQLSERTYKAVRLSSRSSKVFNGQFWRARTYNSTNPLGIGHQFYKKRFVDNERRGHIHKDYDRDKKFIFATIDDNVFSGTEYVKNLEDLSGAELRAYRFGDWTISAGAYFDQWDESLHVIDPIDTIPHTWEISASMDYGYNHWNVVYLHGKDSDGVVTTFAELCHRKHQPDEIAPDIYALLADYRIPIHRLKGFFVGNDVFRMTGQSRITVADQYKAKGIVLKEADVSPGSRIEGAHLMARLLGSQDRDVPIMPRWYVTRNCERLIDCLPYLERDPNNPEDVLKVDADENGKGGDDPYDGVRYGLTMMLKHTVYKAEIKKYA